jgi:hypothetical protein
MNTIRLSAGLSGFEGYRHIYGATPRTAGFNTDKECAQFFNLMMFFY